jgi:hypothetical protein
VVSDASVVPSNSGAVSVTTPMFAAQHLIPASPTPRSARVRSSGEWNGSYARMSEELRFSVARPKDTP